MTHSAQDAAADTLTFRRIGAFVLFMCGVAGGLVALCAAVSSSI